MIVENSDEIVESFQNDVVASFPESNKLIRVFLMFLFFWQALFCISDAGITMVLSFVVLFLRYCGQHLGLAKLIFKFFLVLFIWQKDM